MALLFQITQKLSQGFSGFWVRWPRKVAKLDAQKAWNRVVTPEDEPLIHAALDWQVPIFEAREPEHRPHATTWINGRRWEDEMPTPKKVTPNRGIGNVRPQTSEQTQQSEAVARIQMLIHHGMDPEAAKRKTYLELGWIKEDPS